MNKNNKTILVTGGTGFIGSHTCVSLLEKKYKIIILDSNVNSSELTVKKIEEIFVNNKVPFQEIIFKKGDIRDQNFLRSIFFDSLKRDSPINAVIHFAGLKSVKDSISESIKYWETNVAGSISLFKIMEEFKCFNIVFSSSATVYGNVKKGLINESEKISPINPYGNNKATTELILQDLFNSKANNWKIANLRYFNPIGAHPSGLIGEDPLQKPNNLFPLITRVAIGQYKYLTIFGDDWPTPDGTCIRDYIHVMDLANAHTATLEYLFDNKPQIINLNIGTGIGTSVLELVRYFQSINGCNIPYKFSGRREGDVSKLVADNKLALSILDWIPVKNISDMCKDGYLWQKNELSRF